MSAIKIHLEEKQSEWAIYSFIKDGCPEEEARKYNYEDAVKYLFDGDHDAAWDAFINYTML